VRASSREVLSSSGVRAVGEGGLTVAADHVRIVANVASRGTRRCGRRPTITACSVSTPSRNLRVPSIVSSNSRRFGLFRPAPTPTAHPPGTAIFRGGDPGHSMSAIKRGRVAIMVGGNTVDPLSEEEIFGEMALLEHAARTATAVPLEETELVEIDEPQFYIFVRQNPHFALQLMQLLSERLRRADVLYQRSQDPKPEQ